MHTSYQLPLPTAELVSQIIYAMENQREKAVFNLDEGIVSLIGETTPPARTIELPQWHSSDGFDLMSRFASRARDERLNKALSQGHGVFRAFKDVLDKDAALKQRWLSFKRHEMEKVVAAWWRRHASKGGESPMREVLLEDFSLRFSQECPKESELISRLEKEAGVRLRMEGASFLLLLAPDDTLAGLLSYRVEEDAWHVVFYGVDNPWRGLGLFRLMVDGLARRALGMHVPRILFDSYGPHIGVGSIFERVQGVRPVSMTLEVPLDSYLSSHAQDEDGVPSPYL